MLDEAVGILVFGSRATISPESERTRFFLSDEMMSKKSQTSRESTEPQNILRQGSGGNWPPRPASFGELLTPVEAAQYLRLDETGSHTPCSAVRTLNYWRDKGQLKATKYARRVWYRKGELDRFLAVKTEP